MPTWRKLQIKSLDSIDINTLPDDTSRLFWNNLILIGDKEGRGLLNGAWLRSKTFPLRDDLSPELLISYMWQFEQLGMITIYEVDERKYYEICNWHDYQSTEKEAKSNYPPVSEPVKSWSGVSQELGKNKSGLDIDVDKSRKDKDVDVEGDNNNPNSKELITTFTEYTNLKPGKGANELAEELANAGVISEDIIQAADFLNNSDKHKCVRFTSIEESAIIEMNKRKGKQKVPDPEDYRRYTKGEFGEVGVH